MEKMPRQLPSQPGPDGGGGGLLSNPGTFQDSNVNTINSTINNTTAASTSYLSAEMKFSEGPVSLNALRLALCTMKDRCQRQQLRIDELEKENNQVRQSRTELYQEVKKLHESNMKLREKNLQLNQKLHKQSRENVEVRDQLSSLQDQHSHSIRQLERLQNEVSALATLPVRSVSMHEMTEVAMATSGGHNPTSPDVEKLEEESSYQMDLIKTKLLEQRLVLKSAMQELGKSLRLKEELLKSSSSTGEEVLQPAEPIQNYRQCPMCEARFPLEVSHDAFEAHVVEHFTYEESETLVNFDMVPDAFV